MGHGNDMGGLDNPVIGEIREVGRHLAGIQGGQHGLVVHNLAPGQIDEPHAPLHGADGLGVNHAFGLVGKVNVNGNIIGPLIKLVDVLDHMDVPVQTQCRVHGEERIVSIDIHAQRQCHIGHQGSDGTRPMTPSVFL